MLEFLIFLIIVVGIALVLDWLVAKLLPDMSYPARIIIGVVAVTAVLYRGWHFLSGYTAHN